MAFSTQEAGRIFPRVTVDIQASISAQPMVLDVAHKTALFVDTLGLGDENVYVTFQQKRTSTNLDAANLLIGGAPAQLDVFQNVYPLASMAYQEFVEKGLKGDALEKALDGYLSEQTGPTLAIPFIDLQVGQEIALFVDKLHLESQNVVVSLPIKPSSKDPDARNLLISGAPAQIDAFEHALDYYQQATVDGLYDKGLRAAINNNSLLPTREKAA
jgi:hypothetical protein